MTITLTGLKNFWKHVNKTTTCWLWTACKTEKGYGQLSYDGKRWKAHRFSWLIHFGPIQGAKQVLHKCDTPACVNPDHLWLGTNLENRIDSINKDRQAKGPKIAGARLSVADINAIRKLYKTDLSQREVGDKFKIRQDHVSRIVNLKIWKHVL